MLVSLQQAVELLDEGQLVAIPTETVYGLAADAESEQALSRLYATKGRPSGAVGHRSPVEVLTGSGCRTS
jgi:L-threonylcarbamoyladenylate synthase